MEPETTYCPDTRWPAEGTAGESEVNERPSLLFMCHSHPQLMFACTDKIYIYMEINPTVREVPDEIGALYYCEQNHSM